MSAIAFKNMNKNQEQSKHPKLFVVPRKSPPDISTDSRAKVSGANIHSASVTTMHEDNRVFVSDFANATGVVENDITASRSILTSDNLVENEVSDVSKGSKANLYKCKKCDKEYKQLSSLKKHLCPSQKPAKVACPCCSKQISKSNLSHHLKTHSNMKFKCLKCKMAFKSNANLVKHNEIHTNVSGTTCSSCNKTFSRPSHLKEHMEYHSKLLSVSEGNSDAAMKCRFCSNIFSTSSKLKKHYNKDHKEKGIECSVCGKMFFSSKGIKDHLKQHEAINEVWLDDTSEAVMNEHPSAQNRLDGPTQAVVSEQSLPQNNLDLTETEETICNYEYVVISSIEVAPGEEVTTVEVPISDIVFPSSG